MDSAVRAARRDPLTESADSPTPRDAATLVLLRRDANGPPRVLMGRRGGGARFMPSKIVFPGGAVDPDDHLLSPDRSLPEASAVAAGRASAVPAEALALAAIRETFEETGLLLGAPDPDASERATDAPDGWRAFLAAGLEPRLDALTFFFRAVTPPGLKLRFDARFFFADASAIHGDPDNFAGASGELSDLAWLPVSEAQAMEPPFITGVVLAEIAAFAAERRATGAPFFRHDGGRSRFELL